VGWGWWWRFDLSYLTTTHVGAVQRNDKTLQRWTKPVYDAFLAGAWLLHWTDDTLYWVAKPRVHTEPTTTDRGRRLHHATGAALESDVEPLYFWHGVLVTEQIMVRPETLTATQIQAETNAEVRRVMLERYGYERYVTDIGATVVQADDFGELLVAPRSGDTELKMVRVINSTPEADGSYKRYMLRVPPTVTSGLEGVAWTFGMTPADYARIQAQS
jgi:hypothetical protein